MSRKLWFICTAITAAMLWQVAPSVAGSWQQDQSPGDAQQNGAKPGTAPSDGAKQGATKEGLPPGPGKDALVRVCSGCHLLTVVTTQRKPESGWTDTVIEMRNRGANASDDDLQAIVEYLAKNYGPQGVAAKININTAAAAEIVASLALPQVEADAIVDYRNKNGKFKDLDTVKQVPGIEQAKIDAAKDRIDF